MEPYKEVSVKETVIGESIEVTFVPAKAPIISLARRIYYRRCLNEAKCLEIFLSRIGHLIENPFYLRGQSNDKPDSQQISSSDRRVKTLTTLVRNNVRGILKETLPDEIRESSYFEPTDSNKGYDNLVFNSLLQRMLAKISTGEYYEKVCQDLELAEDVQKDPSRFPEIERICQPALQRFVNLNRVWCIPEEDQYQEGLITLWSVVQEYEARNFARFSTLAKKALDFKFFNLIRFYSTDKRKVERFTSPMGNPSCPEDSFTARELDRLTFQAWRKAERSELLKPEERDLDYTPFLIKPIV